MTFTPPNNDTVAAIRAFLADPRFASASTLTAVGMAVGAQFLQNLIGWAGLVAILITLVLLMGASLLARRSGVLLSEGRRRRVVDGQRVLDAVSGAGVALRGDALPAQAGVRRPVLVELPFVLRVAGQAQHRGLERVAEVQQLRHAVLRQRALLLAAHAFDLGADDQAVLAPGFGAEQSAGLDRQVRRGLVRAAEGVDLAQQRAAAATLVALAVAARLPTADMAGEFQARTVDAQALSPLHAQAQVGEVVARIAGAVIVGRQRRRRGQRLREREVAVRAAAAGEQRRHQRQRVAAFAEPPLQPAARRQSFAAADRRHVARGTGAHRFRGVFAPRGSADGDDRTCCV